MILVQILACLSRLQSWVAKNQLLTTINEVMPSRDEREERQAKEDRAESAVSCGHILFKKGSRVLIMVH